MKKVFFVLSMLLSVVLFSCSGSDDDSDNHIVSNTVAQFQLELDSLNSAITSELRKDLMRGVCSCPSSCTSTCKCKDHCRQHQSSTDTIKLAIIDGLGTADGVLYGSVLGPFGAFVIGMATGALSSWLASYQVKADVVSPMDSIEANYKSLDEMAAISSEVYSNETNNPHACYHPFSIPSNRLGDFKMGLYHNLVLDSIQDIHNNVNIISGFNPLIIPDSILKYYPTPEDFPIDIDTKLHDLNASIYVRTFLQNFYRISMDEGLSLDDVSYIVNAYLGYINTNDTLTNEEKKLLTKFLGVVWYSYDYWKDNL